VCTCACLCSSVCVCLIKRERDRDKITESNTLTTAVLRFRFSSTALHCRVSSIPCVLNMVNVETKETKTLHMFRNFPNSSIPAFAMMFFVSKETVRDTAQDKVFSV